MSDALDRERLLRALDETPQTAERLARRLDADVGEVEAALARAREDDAVADWGRVWATTWRAKLRLSPRFFAVWIPASLALGAALTAIALAVNGPPQLGTAAPLALLVLAAAAAAVAAVPLVRG